MEKTFLRRIKSQLKLGHNLVSSVCPNYLILNYFLALPVFLQENRRLPRGPCGWGANINDYIFLRMVKSGWTHLEKICVDKEFAKIFAMGLCPGLRAPETIDVLSMEGLDYQQFRLWLDGFAGRAAVCKPTHSSGYVLFLSHNNSEARINEFFTASRKNYSFVNREMQYYDLEKKVLIEEDISRGHELLEYKFICTRGKVLCCGIVTGRFADTAITFFSAPDFRRLDVRLGHYGVDHRLTKPAAFEEMCEVASKLSANFDFVRADLYESRGRIYFGELTFTPGAGAFRFSDEGFAVAMLQEVLATRPRAAGAAASPPGLRPATARPALTQPQVSGPSLAPVQSQQSHDGATPTAR